MKRLFIMLVCAFTVILGAYAGSPDKVKYGVTAGANMSTFRGDNAWTYQPGYQVGGTVEIGFPNTCKGLFGRGSVLLAAKGASEGNPTNEYTRSYYIAMPLQIGYKLQCGHTTSVFGAVGPYIAYGIDGTQRGVSVFPNMLNRLDAGAAVTVGVGLGKHFQLAANLDYGLTNALSGKHQTEMYNHTYSLSVSYMF